MTDTTPIACATVLSCHVGRIELAVAKLNARAKRLLAAPYEITVSAPWIRTRRKDASDDQCYDLAPIIREEVVDVTLTGEPVRASGWTFIAKLDFLSDDTGKREVVVSKAPGHETLEIDRPDATRCDHCRAIRRRAVCYVVQNDAGARKVIGSSCLADFTGMGRRNVEGLVALGFLASEIFTGADGDEGGWGGGSGSRATGLDDYLTAVAGIIRCYGWMSRGQARDRGEDRATADLALGWFHCEPGKRAIHYPELGISTTRTDRAVALRAIHWAAQLQPTNDYQENIAVIARVGYMLSKHTGLAASIVSAWLRHRESLVRAASRPRADPDAICGTVGKREIFNVLVAGARVVEGDFGATTRVSLVDTATGAEIVWWASGSVPDPIWYAANDPLPVGATPPVFAVQATVKKYTDYKGSKQTVVKRVTMYVPKAPKAKKPRKVKAAKSDGDLEGARIN